MNKIKDLIYNMNDIIVALLILAVAGSVIYWRVNEIMDYPAYAAAQKSEVAKLQPDFTDVDLTPGEVDQNLNAAPEDFDASKEGETTQPQEGETTQPQEGETKPQEGETKPAETTKEGFVTKADVKFTIPAGSSCDKIGSLLFQQGLIESKEAFVKEVIAQKADTKLQTGTFNIPAGSDMNDIIKIITR
ncbi:MAG: endolytic transglycosylase MltG [Firmicutes bacterium]|nr:endolytic transglycosylase MltG [Bacillota bacterium]